MTIFNDDTRSELTEATELDENVAGSKVSMSVAKHVATAVTGMMRDLGFDMKKAKELRKALSDAAKDTLSAEYRAARDKEAKASLAQRFQRALKR